MPEPYRIQIPSDELRQLLLAFGVVTPPALWELNNSVQPVSIIDSRVNLNAVTSPAIWDVRSTLGGFVAAPAFTRFVDTGQLAAGNYEFIFMASTDQGEEFKMLLRDAADAATVTSERFHAPTFEPERWTEIIKVALNERVVIENQTVMAAGVTAQCIAWYRLLT